MHARALGFLVILAVIAKSEQKFVVPDITIQALSPKGLTVTLADSPGIQQFAFHANINQPIRGKEDGTISKEVGSAEGGNWKITDPNIELKVGDVLHYWVFVQHSRLGFDKQDQRFTVTELVGKAPTPQPTECKQSATRINGGRTACGETIIFEDTFDSNTQLDETKWIREQYIPWKPDYEFNSYEKSSQNCYVNQGRLYLKPSLRDNPNSAELDLSNGCTGKNCTLTAIGTIIPPIISARVKSKFSFIYGKIEIRAQLPQGDWLFPQLYLEPLVDTYGEDYRSGKLWVAYARGNIDLKKRGSSEQIGNTVLYSGAVLGVEDPGRTYQTRTSSAGQSWGNDYHTYTLIWRPDGIFVSVDNGNQQAILPPFSTTPVSYSSNWINPMSPFDREFVVSLGVGAGGHSDFPDDCTSNGRNKPWKKTNAKANLFFYNSRDSWLSSWASDKSALKVDYVKIWSL